MSELPARDTEIMSKYKHELPGAHRYGDMLLGRNVSVEKILRVQAMELEPSDVVVASYPKTGSTLLQEIVWLIRNNGDTDKANKTSNMYRVPFMEFNLINSFEIFTNLPHPRHMKTHLPYRFLPKSAREGTTKVVYGMRNPKDSLVSLYHFYRMNSGLGNFKGSWNDFFDYFKEHNYSIIFGNLLDHMRGYWEHKNDGNIHIVSFEHIVREPMKAVTEIAEFLECSLSEDKIKKIVDDTRFDVMKKNPMTNMSSSPSSILDHNISPFMRKGEVGDWKNYFNDEQNEIMDEMEKHKLAETDLEFAYE